MKIREKAPVGRVIFTFWDDSTEMAEAWRVPLNGLGKATTVVLAHYLPYDEEGNPARQHIFTEEAWSLEGPEALGLVPVKEPSANTPKKEAIMNGALATASAVCWWIVVSGTYLQEMCMA